MTVQHENGRWGEDLAADFLNQGGFEILHRNWRYHRAEIDIVARDGPVIVFIEVKARAYTAFGLPEEKVTPAKQKLLVRAASAYSHDYGYEGEFRFDIIAIVGVPGRVEEIRHFRDAFFPGFDF